MSTSKVALFGQSVFAAEVYASLRKEGHQIVAVFTIPDDNGKEDPVATDASRDGVKVFKFPRWQIKGEPIAEVVTQYESVGADLNVLAYVSQFIPMKVINHPPKGSICYHPSILPRHRGASAINWTLMEGDKKAGLTVFWPDDGLDTGPILLQKECDVLPDDTVTSLYNRFLFPEGVKAMCESVALIRDGKAPKIPQPTEGATYEKIWKDKNLAKVDWSKPGSVIHNFIRGNDKVPGAWTNINGQKVSLFGSTLFTGTRPEGVAVEVEGNPQPGLVTKDGLMLFGSDGQAVLVKQLKLEDTNQTIPASKFGAAEEEETALDLTEEEAKDIHVIRHVWKEILAVEFVEDHTDFFASGAGSMHVVVLKSSISRKCTHIKAEVDPEDVYMNTKFSKFVRMLVEKHRSGGEKNLVVNTVDTNVNGVNVRMPYQLFIDGGFVDAADGATRPTINPTTEEVICQVAQAGVVDVNKAVAAAKRAFEAPEWRRMNASERGRLLYKLADIMEQHKEELAIIESLDSGAVYTLALKTHIGMSIDTFRYFAGCCDKIEGRTIPINNARPNFNLCITKREPIGVCGLVVPWNYPLMMLAWKMAPALAAGNTVVIKPANQTPLTALKFAELTAKAGFPKGVVNVVPGAGALVGEALSNHPDIRKLGFTGSTPVGKTIMAACAKSNAKRVGLELGGKSPLIIFADCDLDRAVKHAVGSAFFNKGENCIAAGRIFVESSIHDEFLEKVVAEVKKMVVGDPLEVTTNHGPQNHKEHLDKLLKYIKTGADEGARLAYGGHRLPRKGFFLEPTVFTDVKDNMYIAKEESFGPVMIILPFAGGVDEVIQRANNSEYGLASGVLTRDINKALKVADAMQAGTVFVNTYNKTDVAAPFGGFKESGFGKDLGQDALAEYTQVKTITIEYF